VNAYAPYCHMSPVLLYNIFPHYLIKDAIWGAKKIIKKNVCFDFLYSIASNISIQYCLEHFYTTLSGTFLYNIVSNISHFKKN